jgi:hypothetical protein
MAFEFQIEDVFVLAGRVVVIEGRFLSGAATVGMKARLIHGDESLDTHVSGVALGLWGSRKRAPYSVALGLPAASAAARAVRPGDRLVAD